jgi:hypothetical protein
MLYNVKITYDVTIAKWRIDDPKDINNADWALMVYDRNLQQWVFLADCNRPGETTYIESIQVMPDKEETPGRTPEVTSDDESP